MIMVMWMNHMNSWNTNTKIYKYVSFWNSFMCLITRDVIMAGIIIKTYLRKVNILTLAKVIMDKRWATRDLNKKINNPFNKLLFNISPINTLMHDYLNTRVGGRVVCRKKLPKHNSLNFNYSLNMVLLKLVIWNIIWMCTKFK